MIPVQQTKFGANLDDPPEIRGNCLTACLASITETDIDGWPAEQWTFPGILRALEDRGWTAAKLDTNSTLMPPVPWVASVPSLNAEPPIRHAIVMREWEVIHDPSTRRTYPLGLLDPAVEVAWGLVLIWTGVGR